MSIDNQSPNLKVIIMGAAGRDFHDFNIRYRERSDLEVVAFTATQIPDIAGRVYPTELAGAHYPNGIPIVDERDLGDLIRRYRHDGPVQVAFCYSDVPHQYVMERAALVQAAGADFILHGTKTTTLKTVKLVISICAGRTGSGKSQTTRYIAEYLRTKGLNVVVVRHPMPYGDLVEQRVQRYSELSDLDRHKCTIEEREEYEHLIKSGVVVFAGVDYEAILREAEKESDVIIWDGGNNDTPFYESTTHSLKITVVDPHRPGHEISYYPGLINIILADIILVNKLDSLEDNGHTLEGVLGNIHMHNPTALISKANSQIFVEGDNHHLITGKRVLIIEDGPTTTHGGMPYGAGYVASQHYHANNVVDPRPHAQGSLAETLRRYPGEGKVLPAMGYSPTQIQDLQDTINKAIKDGGVETVIVATPIDISRLLEIRGADVVRINYKLVPIDGTLDGELSRLINQLQ